MSLYQPSTASWLSSFCLISSFLSLCTSAFRAAWLFVCLSANLSPDFLLFSGTFALVFTDENLHLVSNYSNSTISILSKKIIKLTLLSVVRSKRISFFIYLKRSGRFGPMVSLLLLFISLWSTEPSGTNSDCHTIQYWNTSLFLSSLRLKYSIFCQTWSIVGPALSDTFLKFKCFWQNVVSSSFFTSADTTEIAADILILYSIFLVKSFFFNSIVAYFWNLERNVSWTISRSLLLGITPCAE